MSENDESFWDILWQSYPGQVIQAFTLFTVILVILGSIFVAVTTGIDALMEAPTPQEAAPPILLHVEPVPCSTPSALELAHCGGKPCPSSECTHGR